MREVHYNYILQHNVNTGVNTKLTINPKEEERRREVGVSEESKKVGLE